ncbi:MAG: acyl-CoA thioesterase [Candidatus Omnitrophica bacterium]|nr:acyl-CoA thioesterase [Candidatus Omnitrophota bacterium]
MNPIMYTYSTKIKLHETDAAGLLFFSHQLKLMHDAYESLLEKIGFGFADLIRKKPYFLPIVHAEADYDAPLFVGDVITIGVTVERIGKTSFTFAYTITDQKKRRVGAGKTVHVTMNKKTRNKISLPAELRTAIEKIKK